MRNKVPQVIFAFWVTRILGTTVGETGADYLADHIERVVAFVASLALHPWPRWLPLFLVSVGGTFITDGFSVSLFISTVVFSVAQAILAR